MDLVDHLFTGAAFILAAVAAWFSRQAARAQAVVEPKEPHGLRLARASLASAKAMYPASSGDELLRHALAVFRELDLSEDGQRDYSDRQAGLYLRAAAAEVAHGNG